MTNLRVTAIDTHRASPADHAFGAEISESGTELLVPREIASALAQLSVRTAIDFIAYARSFPSTVASVLGWKVEDVNRAMSALIEKLHGFVPEDILNNTKPTPRLNYGAVDPHHNRMSRDNNDASTR